MNKKTHWYLYKDLNSLTKWNEIYVNASTLEVADSKFREKTNQNPCAADFEVCQVTQEQVPTAPSSYAKKVAFNKEDKGSIILYA